MNSASTLKMIRNPYIYQVQIRNTNTKIETRERTSGDLIGPPNPVSNLRPIRFTVKDNESALEKLLRNKRQEVQTWNEEFWTKHNTEFICEKNKFMKKELLKKGTSQANLNADEMSVFYKKFLDDNWKRHLTYNFMWYKKNISIIVLDIRVKVQRLLHIFR